MLVSFLVFHKICLDQQLHFTWCSYTYHTATYIRSFTHIVWSCKYVIFTRNILWLDVRCDFAIFCLFSPNPTFNVQVYYDITESSISNSFNLKDNLLFGNVFNDTSIKWNLYKSNGSFSRNIKIRFWDIHATLHNMGYNVTKPAFSNSILYNVTD